MQAMEAQEAISVWGPGSEAWEAAQRTYSGRLVGGGWGCWQPGGPTSTRELRPASSTVLGSRLPWGLWGCSQVLRGRCQHGP